MAFTGEHSISLASRYGETQDTEEDVASALSMIGVRAKAISKLTSHGIGAVEKSVAAANDYLEILGYPLGKRRIGQLASLDPHKFLSFNPILLCLALHYWGKRPATVDYSKWKAECVKKLKANGRDSISDISDIDIVRYILLCDTNTATSPFDYY